MDTEFWDAIGEGLDECAELSGESFVVGRANVLGDFTGATEDVELTTTGGKRTKLKGTLLISRSRLRDKPANEMIVTGPGGTRYRVHEVESDPVSWTLFLTAPNGK